MTSDANPKSSNPNRSQAAQGEKTSTFTVDSREITGTQFVPSVSKLLNRRKLERRDDQTQETRILPAGVALAQDPGKTGVTPTQTPVPAASEPAMLIQLSPAPPAPATETAAAPSAKIAVKTLKKRPRASAAPMTSWTVSSLESSTDPLAHGLRELLKAGATDAVFLAITPPVVGAKVPHFAANSGLGRPERLELWRGLVWDPTVAPAAWNAFLKTGVIEFAPPATQTQPSSERNILRTAFGANAGEYVVLCRIGPTASCRGALMVFAPKSLGPALSSALAHFQSASKSSTTAA